MPLRKSFSSEQLPNPDGNTQHPHDFIACLKLVETASKTDFKF